MRQYIVNAFTNKPFEGNPAAVCVMEQWPEEQTMMEMEEEVANCHPNDELLKNLPGRMVHITAPSKTYTCQTRSFGPKIGIKEDPVCGSSYCQVAPYWSEQTGKPLVIAHQASKRGGALMCTVEEDKVKIAGEAQLFAISELILEE